MPNRPYDDIPMRSPQGGAKSSMPLAPAEAPFPAATPSAAVRPTGGTPPGTADRSGAEPAGKDEAIPLPASHRGVMPAASEPAPRRERERQDAGDRASRRPDAQHHPQAGAHADRRGRPLDKRHGVDSAVIGLGDHVAHHAYDHDNAEQQEGPEKHLPGGAARGLPRPRSGTSRKIHITNLRRRFRDAPDYPSLSQRRHPVKSAGRAFRKDAPAGAGRHAGLFPIRGLRPLRHPVRPSGVPCPPPPTFLRHIALC